MLHHWASSRILLLYVNRPTQPAKMTCTNTLGPTTCQFSWQTAGATRHARYLASNHRNVHFAMQGEHTGDCFIPSVSQGIPASICFHHPSDFSNGLIEQAKCTIDGSKSVGHRWQSAGRALYLRLITLATPELQLSTCCPWTLWQRAVGKERCVQL